MRYVTRPLTIEARTRLRGVKPIRGPFSATWSATEVLLDKELWQLGATEFVLQIDIDESMLKLNGELRSSARPATPAVAISFESSRGPLLFTCGKFTDWRENVRAIALGLEALRKVDRYGITQAAEQYKGFGALPPGTPMPAASAMSTDDAARIIAGAIGNPGEWLKIAASPDVMKAAYRRAAAIHHPDVEGGDADYFRRITEARDLLLGGQ